MKAAISILGVQTPIQRFGEKTRDREEGNIPRVAPWRCNLTGLSHTHNLYFSAFVGEVYVYEPQFPSQALPSKPSLIVNTPPSQPGLFGSLDPRDPRAINYLILQNLGHEEILAVARDDGDVEVYLVAHIAYAVSRCSAGELTAEVRPFFQRNVRLSAWGLAVHCQARILAVSSNTHSVTIYKFGLVGGEEERSRDVEQVIVNGTANIPCIAFCNTEDDVEGRWLATTDILGRTRLIDLKEMRLAQSLSFSGGDGQLGYDRHHAGWGVMFLDRRSFVEERELDNALGVGHAMKGQVWDLSQTLSRHTAAGSRPDESADAEDVDSSSILDSYSSSREEEEEEGDEASPAPSEDFSDEDTLPTDNIFSNNLSRQQNHQFHSTFNDHPPCPILHASVRNVYLLQPPPSPQKPLIGFSNILFHAGSPGLYQFDRLNMHAMIPSLGIVVLASQAGSAVVLALTKVSTGGKTVYTMRVDNVLPLAEQERPRVPLMGIAIGPMQGCEMLRDDGKNRWRLLMTYYDGTVFGYELKRNGGISDVGIESVIV